MDERLYPNGTILQENTGVPSPVNYENVDDEHADETDYNISPPVNGAYTDIFSFTNLSKTGSISLVAASWASSTQIIYSTGIQFFLYINGVKYYGESWAVNPATGNLWTPADINSIQAGYELTTFKGSYEKGDWTLQTRCWYFTLVVTITTPKLYLSACLLKQDNTKTIGLDAHLLGLTERMLMLSAILGNPLFMVEIDTRPHTIVDWETVNKSMQIYIDTMPYTTVIWEEQNE